MLLAPSQNKEVGIPMKAILYRDLRGLNNVIEWSYMIFALIVAIALEIFSGGDSEGFLLASVIIGNIAVFCPMMLLVQDVEQGVMQVVHTSGLGCLRYVIAKMIVPLCTAWLVEIIDIAYTVWATGIDMFQGRDLANLTTSMMMILFAVTIGVSLAFLITMLGKQSAAGWRITVAVMLLAVVVSILLSAYMSGFSLVGVLGVACSLIILSNIFALLIVHRRTDKVLHHLS